MFYAASRNSVNSRSRDRFTIGGKQGICVAATQQSDCSVKLSVTSPPCPGSPSLISTSPSKRVFCPMLSVHPVILSGGAGSRLWPLSRSLFPKQLLALAGKHSLIQDTALRAAGGDFAAPLIICNVEHRFLIAQQMRETGIVPQAIVLEPMGRNTAPAAAIAALIVQKKDPEGVLLLM